ncbi:VCBS repeat-containing protein [Bacillus cereus group sp. BfR-BA-01352]|uniref:FG-GAP repeat domain-containing protein n=1 Tax=Bacillus cereus group sp. BfR-BA-01352 TaxID=2920315 RepID=UPI001F5658E3|nr:VCBS repeat-containing protein [Bacillus cereus group sp. BfR-BA-01352]
MSCPSFSRAINYMVGTHPVGITSGDFNGDGQLDLAVANNSFISILLGAGNGTFLPAMNINIGDSPLIGILAADFNGDGILDLAVTNDEPGNVISILLGNGDGTFQSPTNYATGTRPGQFVAADFNGDGILDLAVTNDISGNVSIFLGNGDGTFQPSTFYPAGDAPIAITTGDFNGDGKLDLAVTDVAVGANNVSVLLGNGDGTFQSPSSLPVGQTPVGIASADFNGDGKLDLVVANEDSQNISVLLGNGDGTFQPAVNYLVGTVGSFPLFLTVADFNNDGLLDLAVGNLGTNNISVLLGNGDGTFQAAVNFEVGQSPEVIIAADFNNDGAIDIAVPNYESNNVSVLLNNCFSSCGQQHSQQVCYVLQFNISTEKFSTTVTCESCDQSVTFNPTTGNLTITLPFTVTYTATITNTFELDCSLISVQANF